METQLAMSYMQNIFATCWFEIAQMQYSLLKFLIRLKFILPVHVHITYCL